MEEELLVEVAYALPQRQRVVRLRLPPGASVLDAIQRSGLLNEFPQIDLRENTVGVWGKPASLRQRLRTRDRVEIYRPLQADPKQRRRLEAIDKKPRSGRRT